LANSHNAIGCEQDRLIEDDDDDSDDDGAKVSWKRREKEVIAWKVAQVQLGRLLL
jgi:hypothetical protein